VIEAAAGGIRLGDRRPSVPGRIVLVAVRQEADPAGAAPDDHPRAGPDCGVEVTHRGRPGQRYWGPGVVRGVVARPIPQVVAVVPSPDHHDVPGPDDRMPETRAGRPGERD